MKLTLAHDHRLPTGVLGLATTPDGRRAFAACADGGVYAVDTATGNATAFEARHASYASGCVLLPDGRTLISGGYDGMLLWHDVETRRCWRRLVAHRFWSWQLALSADGSRLASVTGQYLPGGWKYEPAAETEPSVRVFDAVTGESVADFPHTPPVLSCAFSPDGSHLAAANMLGEVKVWEMGGRVGATLAGRASGIPGGGTPPSTAGGTPAATGAPFMGGGLGGQPRSAWKSADFTSWGSIKTHHYCGGIYGLAFAPDGGALLGCGMGPMTDPMAGNGKMTWQRWDWRKGERLDQIRDGQHGSGLMETVAWHPRGSHFVMAGRQAQGTWNAALFSATDGGLVHSLDTKKRITHARFSADGGSLVLAGANGQGQPKDGVWPKWGRLQVYRVEV